MKNLILGTLLIASSNTHSSTAILVKSSYFLPNGKLAPTPELRAETCEVSATSVVVHRQFGLFGTKSVHIVNVDEPALRETIKLMQQETRVEKKTGRLDGFFTRVYAGTIQNPVTLYSSGDNFDPAIGYQGAHSKSLMDFLNQYCPTTY